MIISLSIFSFKSRQQENVPSINKEIVRSDIISNYKDFIDEEYFRTRDTSMFFVMYLNRYCLVHIPYRISNISEKASVIAVYHLVNNGWRYQNAIPYYSSLEQISDTNYFLSENEYCEANMSCNSYVEVSELFENNMIPILSYYGFNYEVYYDILASSGEIGSVLKNQNDTIKNQVHLSDFKFNKGKLKSYKLERNISILSNVKKNVEGFDSIVIKRSTIVKLINIYPPR